MSTGRSVHGIIKQYVNILKGLSHPERCRGGMARDPDRIEELVKEYNATRIVLGLPKNMNNTLGDRAEKSMAFKEMLERRTGLCVVLWDERLTTVAADRTMMEAGIRREHRKEYVDEIAAVFILQNYLDYLSCHPVDNNNNKKEDA